MPFELGSAIVRRWVAVYVYGRRLPLIAFMFIKVHIGVKISSFYAKSSEKRVNVYFTNVFFSSEKLDSLSSLTSTLQKRLITSWSFKFSTKKLNVWILFRFGATEMEFIEEFMERISDGCVKIHTCSFWQEIWRISIL